MAARFLSLIILKEATQETESSSSCVDTIFGHVRLRKSTFEKKNIVFRSLQPAFF